MTEEKQRHHRAPERRYSNMELIRAKDTDIALLTAFYRYVTVHTGTMAKFGRWVYGLHPTDQMIISYIHDGNMYYIAEDEKIISAVAAVPFQTEEYHGTAWKAELNDQEVGPVHLLCVHPDYQGQGYSRQVMKAVENLMHIMNKKAVRLDALVSNIPARNLYESIGYHLCGTKHWYAENTGWTDFVLYEKSITELTS